MLIQLTIQVEMDEELFLPQDTDQQPMYSEQDIIDEGLTLHSPEIGERGIGVVKKVVDFKYLPEY